MQAMSEGMAALLKSGKQIGVNRPSHEVIIGNVIGNGGSNYTWDVEKNIRATPIKETPVEYQDWYGGDWGGGSFITRSDGKILVTYSNFAESKIYLSTVDTEDDIFYNDNESITNEWVFATLTGGAYPARLFKTATGKILLFVTEKGDFVSVPNTVKVYSSANGLGTDFALITTIYSYQLPGSNIVQDGSYQVGQPIQLPSGRILITFIAYESYVSNFSWPIVICTYSDDDGLSWTNVTLPSDGNETTCKGIGKFGNQLITTVNKLSSSGTLYLLVSTNEGTSWSVFTSTTGGTLTTEGTLSSIFWGNDGYSYWAIIKKLYRHPDNVELVTGTCFNKGEGEPWGLPVVEFIHSDNAEYMWKTENNNIAYAGTNSYGGKSVSHILGGIGESTSSIKAKSIQINRSKGMAGSLTVEFDNKDGILAPDGLENPQLFWPNKEITVKQGYGTELIQTFKGLIDTISMSTFPQSISISARDKMKALLDHLARDSSFSYVLTYTGQTVEAMWQDLITKAGLTYGTVETTGITLTEKVFSWQTYADCISWLDEIAGFETYCDEFGVMHFVLDGRPAVVTTSYSFVEGVDIIQLGYDIDDKDLYYSVAVYGKDTNDAVIYYAATLPQAVYWNIPSGKVMRIDAPDADTSAKCQAIADKAIYLMQTRARQVKFSTIGIPHLQRGDFIQVTEASSTISEIYRITDISTSQDSSGYRMELTCYYHAAPEV